LKRQNQGMPRGRGGAISLNARPPSRRSKIATGPPSGLGLFRFVTYRNGFRTLPLSLLLLLLPLRPSPPPRGGVASNSSAAARPPTNPPGRRCRVDVVLSSLGGAGRGRRLCAVRVFVSSVTVYKMSSVCAFMHTSAPVSTESKPRVKWTYRGRQHAAVHFQEDTLLHPEQRAYLILHREQGFRCAREWPRHHADASSVRFGIGAGTLELQH
jgi:hypothetical protein